MSPRGINMTEVRIEDKPAFLVAGQKIWISGQDNELFGNFWKESHENGLTDRLTALSGGKPGEITKSYVFGVSCVDKDPNNRAFDFYIAAEAPDNVYIDSLECREIPAAKWAIFSNKGDLPMSLVNAEMYAFMEWLPHSGFKHANAPEIEVYPASDSSLVEFWMPIQPND